MIHERRRLIPTMIAVIIGVAFMASTLMLMDSMKASALRTQAADPGEARLGGMQGGSGRASRRSRDWQGQDHCPDHR